MSTIVGDDTTAGFIDESGGLVEIVGSRRRDDHGVDGAADVERDDVGALLGEPDRLCAADSPRSAGDQCDLSRQPGRSCRLLREAGIDDQLGARDVTGFVGGQEHDRIGDVHGFHPRHRKQVA